MCRIWQNNWYKHGKESLLLKILHEWIWYYLKPDNMTDIIKHLLYSVFIIQLSKFPLWMKKDTIYSYSFMCRKWKHTIKEQFNFVVDMLLVVRLPFLMFSLLWQNAIFSVILFYCCWVMLVRLIWLLVRNPPNLSALQFGEHNCSHCKLSPEYGRLFWRPSIFSQHEDMIHIEV